jgi:hypothetical protein
VSIAWWVFFGCIALGAIFGLRGLLLPLIGVPASWIGRDIAGEFVNHSGNGDNFGAEAALSSTFWIVVGAVGVIIGFALRALAREVRERFSATP